MARYLVDTDVMIDVSRGGQSAANFIDSLDEFTISIITAHELILGARDQRDAEAIDVLISAYPVHDNLGAEITRRAYELLKRLREIGRASDIRCFDRSDCNRRRAYACLEKPKTFPHDQRSKAPGSGLLIAPLSTDTLTQPDVRLDIHMSSPLKRQAVRNH